MKTIQEYLKESKPWKAILVIGETRTPVLVVPEIDIVPEGNVGSYVFDDEYTLRVYDKDFVKPFLERKKKLEVELKEIEKSGSDYDYQDKEEEISELEKEYSKACEDKLWSDLNKAEFK